LIREKTGVKAKGFSHNYFIKSPRAVRQLLSERGRNQTSLLLLFEQETTVEKLFRSQRKLRGTDEAKLFFSTIAFYVAFYHRVADDILACQVYVSVIGLKLITRYST